MDERLSLPSASGMDRLMRCPGSFQREQGIDLPDSPAAQTAARAGERIHAVLEGVKDISSLKAEEEKWTRLIIFQEAQLVEKHGMEGAHIQIREQRYWMELEPYGKLFSGKPDSVHKMGSKILNVNYKTGKYAPLPIQENWQIRTECALLCLRENAETVIGATIQPKAILDKREPVCEQTFSRIELQELLVEVVEGCQESFKDNALVVPGEQQCKYCKAAKAGICPEYQEWRQHHE